MLFNSCIFTHAEIKYKTPAPKMQSSHSDLCLLFWRNVKSEINEKYTSYVLFLVLFLMVVVPRVHCWVVL